MSRQDIAAALDMTFAEVTSACKALFFAYSTGPSCARRTDAYIWGQVREEMERRVAHRAYCKKMQPTWDAWNAAAWAEFDACDRRAGWAK